MFRILTKAGIEMKEDETPFCCRCYEDFPVAEEPSEWTMGQMRKLKLAPKKVRDELRQWLDEDLYTAYLCGNCYFDLTDEEE